MRTISLVRPLSAAIIAVGCALALAQPVSAQGMHGGGGREFGGFHRGSPFHSDGFEGFGGGRFRDYEGFHHRGFYPDGEVWFCSDPEGYFPDTEQCNTVWDRMPAD